MANDDYTAQLDEIKAAVVPEMARLSVFPKFFGTRFMLVGESAIYNWMGALCSSYDGGLWNFYELSNGGFYMAPCDVEKFDVIVRRNHYTGTMSADAAGITACLFAFGQLANQTAQPHIIDLYYKLREYALRHFEASEIIAAID